MSDTRRCFLRSAATLGAGLAGATPALLAQRPEVAGGRGPADSIPDSEIKVPKVKFGKVALSRFVVGSNPFNGGSHFNSILSGVMKEWYTPAKVLEVMQRCEKYGINVYNYIYVGRVPADWERFVAEGGHMYVVAQGIDADPTELVKAVKPMGVWVQGERTDNAYRAGKMETIRDYCKKLRDLGVEMVGVGSHIPEVLALVEERGWDVDFYAGCVYNRRRTQEELRKLMGGELPEMPSEVYLQDDPPRMYKVLRQTKKPCIAFKIMGAGRVRNAEAAFKLAFQSIKPYDLVCVGLFPRIKDEVKENAYWTFRYGTASS
jgi:hypothetical protein